MSAGLALDQASRVAGTSSDSGRLWISPASSEIPNGTTLIVSLAPEADAWSGGREHVWHLPDSQFHPVDPDSLATTVALVRTAHDAGDSVVVRCRSGFNRSALVVGGVLRGLGVAGATAVARIRAARGPLALSNPYFHDLVRSWPHDPMTGNDLTPHLETARRASVSPRSTP